MRRCAITRRRVEVDVGIRPDPPHINNGVMHIHAYLQQSQRRYYWRWSVVDEDTDLCLSRWRCIKFSVDLAVEGEQGGQAEA